MIELTDKEDSELNDLLVDLEVAFLNGAYEPSERGAGFAASDEGREDAHDMLVEYTKKIIAATKVEKKVEKDLVKPKENVNLAVWK